jgi:hypothetical protein
MGQALSQSPPPPVNWFVQDSALCDEKGWPFTAKAIWACAVDEFSSHGEGAIRVRGSNRLVNGEKATEI